MTLHIADGRLGRPRGMWLIPGHITGEGEELGLNPAVPTELGSWLNLGLPLAVRWAVLCHCAWNWHGVEGDQSISQRWPWGALCKKEAQVSGPQEVTSLPWQESPTELETWVTRNLHSREAPYPDPLVRDSQMDVFCCVLIFGAHCLRIGCSERLYQLWRSWVSFHPRRLWLFAKRNAKVKQEGSGQVNTGQANMLIPTSVAYVPNLFFVERYMKISESKMF